MNFWNSLSPLFKAIFCVLLSALSFAIMAAFLRLSGMYRLHKKRFFATHSIDKRLYCVEKSPIILWLCRKSFVIIKPFHHRVIGDFMWCIYHRSPCAKWCRYDWQTHVVHFNYSFAIFLKERASLLQWILCLIAFIGALFIIKPAVDIRFMPYLVGVIGSVFAAIAYLCLRLLAKTKKVESPNTIVFFFLPFRPWYYCLLSPLIM